MWCVFKMSFDKEGDVIMTQARALSPAEVRALRDALSVRQSSQFPSTGPFQSPLVYPVQHKPLLTISR